MKIRLLRPAVEDLWSGHVFYDRQRPGLGSGFFNRIFAEIDSLAKRAGFHRMVFSYHRSLSKRFPYAIYYRISGEEIVIARVINCRRNPNWIRTALGRTHEER